jgi:hypothetical protein
VGTFVVGYIVLGHITYLIAINDIREVTGLDHFRANKVYKAALTGNWSEISDDELRLPDRKKAASKDTLSGQYFTGISPDFLFPKRESKSKLKIQLIGVMIMERTRRETAKESDQMYKEILDKTVENADPETLEELRKNGFI